MNYKPGDKFEDMGGDLWRLITYYREEGGGSGEVVFKLRTSQRGHLKTMLVNGEELDTLFSGPVKGWEGD